MVFGVIFQMQDALAKKDKQKSSIFCHLIPRPQLPSVCDFTLVLMLPFFIIIQIKLLLIIQPFFINVHVGILHHKREDNCHKYHLK